MVSFELCDKYKKRLDAYRPLQSAELRSIREYYRIGLTYASNALEGNSLTESETKVVIEDGLTVSGRPLRDVYEAVGHAKAYDFLYSLPRGEPLTLRTVLTLHKLFYQQIDAANAGKLRRSRVFLTGSRYPLPPPAELRGLILEFVDWFNTACRTLHPVEFAAQVHLRFVFIHPFTDGNGRVARLLMNLALLRGGYSIAVISPVLRSEYISALEEAHENPEEFCAFIARQVVETEKDLLRLLGPLPASCVRETACFYQSGSLLLPPEDDAEVILQVIEMNPGINTPGIAEFAAVSVPTISRRLRELKAAGKIEFRGPLKNGGYFLCSAP